MAVANGADFVIEVETATPTVYVAVGDMDGQDQSTDQAEEIIPVFGGTKYVVPGVRDVTFSVSGYHNGSDAGQALLYAAEKARTEIKIRVKYDGTNGFSVLTRVRSRKHSAKASGGLQPVTFDFIATAASVAVGTGPAI